MIRYAELKDLNDCTRLAVEFFSPFLEKHGVNVVVNDVYSVAVKTISSHQALVVEREGKVCGVTAWAIVPHPANSKIRIFYETIWCVRSEEPTDTLALLRALEDEAVKAKADMIVVANLSEENEEQLKRIYTGQGFSFLETHYAKQLGG